MLASAPLGAIIQGWTWLGDAALAAAVVVALGLALHRLGPLAVVAGQCLGLLVLLAARFADTPLPGPTAFARFAALAAGAGTQIATGIAPVPATPEILFLVTVAFGAVLVAVYGAAVLAGAPAAAGVPLLAVFAVPAALDDSLLPWQAVVFAAAGFGVLLVLRDGARSQRLGGVVLVAVAVVAALGVGAAGTFVGTAGRFAGAGAGGSGAIGLSPFTTLRGQLTQERPTELFEVRGLPQPAYLRALTLSTYVPDVGWQATRPGPGPNLPGTLGVVAGGAVQIATVDVRNVGFKDYWLPLYGQPISVAGLSGRWTYDERTGTAYTARPRAEDGWQQMADFSVPTAGQLRDARGSTGPVAAYLDTAGVDRRVIDLANQVTGRAGTPFDKAIALQDFFTGPSSGFQYSLQTAPGNGDDALVEFLTQGKTGYCEQFAAAMAVMLRAVGVPARVAVGFTGGTPDGDHRSISTSDAHAWVEAWFPGRGWLIFDPTPLTDGRTIVPPYVAEAQAEQAAAAGAPVGAEAAQEPRRGTDPGADADPGAHGPGRPGPRRARRRAAAVAVRAGWARGAARRRRADARAPAGPRAQAAAGGRGGGRAGGGRGGLGRAARRVDRPGRARQGERHRAGGRPPPRARAPPRRRRPAPPPSGGGGRRGQLVRRLAPRRGRAHGAAHRRGGRGRGGQPALGARAAAAPLGSPPRAPPPRAARRRRRTRRAGRRRW